MLSLLRSRMDSAYQAQVAMAPDAERARLRVVNLLALLGVVLSVLYIVLYGWVLHSPVSVALNAVFTVGYASYFAVLRTSSREFARLWLAVVFVAQIAVFSVLVYPKESGFHLYIISGVPFAYLVFGHDERWRRAVTVLAMMATFLAAELLDNPKILGHLPATTFRVNYLIVVPLVTVLVAVVLNSFLRELHQRDEALRLLTVTDPLTGIANRRGFLERAESLLAQTLRLELPVCVLMLDIDHFKRVNDVYGHHVGDRLLQTVASALRDRLRKMDVLGRVGGEEFAVVLANTPLPMGLQLADTLRQQVASVRVEAPDGEVLRCTISVGVAALEGSEESIGRALSRADRALYQAKADGRNRVCAADLLSPPVPKPPR